MSDGIDYDQVEIEFENKYFCFTGKFSYGSQKECEKATKDLGGRSSNNNSLCKNTNYLVVGEKGNSNWVNGASGGTKVEKAKKNQIPVVSEEQWVEALDRYLRAA